MERLESYLSDDFVKEKEQQKSVRVLIEKVIPTFGKFNEKKGWAYNLEEDPKDIKNISTSTTAMVAFSMSVLMSGKLDLVIEETGENFFKHYEKNNNVQINFEEILQKSLDLLLNTFASDENKKENTFKSKTYGENDPFTLMWTRYLIDNNEHVTEEIKSAFNNVCKEKIKKLFKTLYEDKNNMEFSTKIEKNHIFPLLKMVQLYYAMISSGFKFFKNVNEKKKIEKYVNEVRNTLNNSLHYHLSLASIENSNFDAAELVFSLEGLLLLDSNRNNFDQNLLNRIFQVIKERQKISLYWRPLKPFVFNEQGLALLPLSVEIAMSLIRICRLLDKVGEKLFSKNYEMFEKYTEWLKTRVTIVPCDKEVCNKCETKKWCPKKSANEKKFYGWCSEHIYQPNVIHLWETSQVLVYLVNFDDMLQKNITYQSFKFANFSTKNCGFEEGSWSKWEESEPVIQEQFRVYEDIGEHYIKSDDGEDNYYSMLLYGPPGTGKSMIAEEIAKAKGWPLVTITPSDFITSGADQVETKAKSIFKVLEEQKKMVVLFDEIDRLILDRDSDYYTSQSDLFQFMTPSMLVKLKDLRKEKKIIFIIATNYAERIDMAIKRKGRIDKHYLVLPPDEHGRERLFQELIIKKLDRNIPKFTKCKDLILRKTVFFTYTEFEQLSDVIKNKNTDLVKGGKVVEEKLKELIEKPAITLMSYKGKLGTEKVEKNTQKPIKEFLSLVFLKAETYKDGDADSVFDENEIGLLIKFLCSKEMIGKDPNGDSTDDSTDNPTDDSTDDLNFILADGDTLEKKLKEHINGKMALKIIEVLNGIKQVRDQRGGR